MKKKWMVHRDGSWRHCRRNFLPAKVFSHNFFREKLKFRCYWWLVVNQHLRKGLDVFLRFRKRVWNGCRNIGIVERSSRRKCHQWKQNVHVCYQCKRHVHVHVHVHTCRICNSWSVQKKRLFSVKTVHVLLCYKSNGQCLACVHPIRDALG